MDISNQLSKVIDVLAQKLGVAVDKVAPILYKQTEYVKITDFIWCSVFLIGLISSTVIFMRCKKDARVIKGYYDDDINGAMGICIVSVIVAIVCLILFIVVGNELLQVQVNPDYYIYKKYILDVIQNK